MMAMINGKKERPGQGEAATLRKATQKVNADQVDRRYEGRNQPQKKVKYRLNSGVSGDGRTLM